MNPRASLAALLACLLAAACASGSPASAARPSAATPSPPAASPAPAGPTPTGTPAGCRIPVASGDAPVDGRVADGSAGHGGFLHLPDGAFSVDPSSLGTYDRAVSRWLPVYRAWVSSDGSKYAWGEYRTAPGPTTGIIHVVDAASGADHPVTVPAPSAVVSYETEGIYITRVVPDSGAPPQGLVLVDPGSGAAHQVVADGNWVAIGGGFAYGQDVDPAVPPPAGGGPGQSNRIRKVDLHSGAVTNVASYPGQTARVLGVYGASPLIGVSGGGTYTVFLGTGTTVFAGPTAGAGADPNPGAPVVVDGSTLWFSSFNSAVWRWDGSGRATRVASTPLGSLQVAGACR